MARHEDHDHDGHDQAHGADRAHVRAPKDFGVAFALGTALIIGFVIVEVTYGLRRGTILGGLANAMLPLVTVGAIAVEGMRRLIEPGEVAGITVMVVAALGIAVNGVTAWLFASGRNNDINLRAAFFAHGL